MIRKQSTIRTQYKITNNRVLWTSIVAIHSTLVDDIMVGAYEEVRFGGFLEVFIVL